MDTIRIRIGLTQFEVDDCAETVPYRERAVRDTAPPGVAHRPKIEIALAKIAAFTFVAFLAWKALEFLVRELG